MTPLRPARPQDTPALLGLSVAAGMFQADEVGFFGDILNAPLPGHGVQVWADSPDDLPVGGAYFGPNDMTDGTWDLWWIAVSPQRQGEGIGGELLHFTEEQVRAGGGRQLLIETSSRPQYDKTRAFYLGRGYDEVARIPDFYAEGDSKVVFLKRVAPVRHK